MDKWILNLVLFFVRIFVRDGVDFDRLKIITETKVLMDRRRVYMSWRQRQQKENSNPLLMTLIFYGIIGFVVGSMLYSIKALIPSMVFVHSYILFMMTMTMITDFSSVLLDTTDNQIILPRPVNSKTLFIARLVHILVYLLQFTIALALFPIIFTFMWHGPLVGIAAIFTILLTVALAVFTTYLIYGLILRFGNEQKIKDIVGYFQIFMTVFFAVGFQIIPRMINFDKLTTLFHLHWYSYFLPPCWMALSLEAVDLGSADSLHLLMMVCAVFIPLFTFWLMFKYLAPSFARKLSALNTDRTEDAKGSGAVQHKKSISEKLSAVFCQSPNESAGFELVWKITGRDKGFKLQFYPSLGYMFVFVFIFVFKSGQDMKTLWENLPNTKMFLFFIYLPMFSIAGSRIFITFNENFAASWIYQSTPLAKPGEIITGGMKALLTKFFLPVYLLFFVATGFIWGIQIADDFLLGFFNNLLIFLISAFLSNQYLPFSRQPNSKQQSGKFAQSMLQLVVIVALVGMHYLVLQINWLIYLVIPLVALACILLIKRLQQTPWLKISI